MTTYLLSAFLCCAPCYSGISAQQQTPIQNVSLAPVRNIEAAETEKKVDQLLLLMQKRLSIMHDVARTKWNQGLPIEDKAREAQILKGLVGQSKNIQADESWIARFFQAQMDAAKEVQRSDFAIWEKRSVQKFAETIPLSELRVYIDEVNREMIDLLSRIPDLAHSDFILHYPISTRESDFIDKKVWDLAVSPWTYSQKEETSNSR